MIRYRPALDAIADYVPGRAAEAVASQYALTFDRSRIDPLKQGFDGRPAPPVREPRRGHEQPAARVEPLAPGPRCVAMRTSLIPWICRHGPDEFQRTRNRPTIGGTDRFRFAHENACRDTHQGSGSTIPTCVTWRLRARIPARTTRAATWRR